MNFKHLFFVMILLPLVSTRGAESEPEWGRWAAVAFSRANGGRVGKAYSERSEYLAKTAALRGCFRNGCEIKAYVERGCVAIAEGYGESLLHWYSFGAATYRRDRDETAFAAAEGAIRACENASRSKCTATTIFCTWHGEESSSPEQIANWIGDMGGEASVYRVAYLVNAVTSNYLLNLGMDLKKATCLAGKRWATVSRLATQCRLTVADLELLYAN